MLNKIFALFQLIPGYVKEYALRYFSSGKYRNPKIYIDISQDTLFSSYGRHLYVFLKCLTSVDQEISFLRKISLLDYKRMGRYGRWICGLNDVSFFQKIPQYCQDKILIYDSPDSEIGRKDWKKRIYLNYDIAKQIEFPNGQNWVMPFPMHPGIYRREKHQKLSSFRAMSKSLKILFAGNLDPKLYSEANEFGLLARFQIVPRSNIVQALMSELNSDFILIEDEAQKNRVFAGEYTNKCLAINSKKCHTPQDYWLETLAKSDFFLCAPGAYMPLCHNAVEAMSVGTIPLINYPDWFCPSLKDLHNCIRFESEADLIDRVEFILNMPRPQIAELRQNVLDYFETHMSVENFLHELIVSDHEDITLHLNTSDVDILEKMASTSLLFNAVTNYPQDREDASLF
ncbi:hypothetical protein C7271_04140 [filamentous cyanobacterium CCP5]|nr:hypothetical protein C7271_04140 [filamentous cyanobacterium CCP5]